MSQFTKIEQSRLLLVEGPDEVFFFGALAATLPFENEIQISHFGGRDQLQIYLSLALADSDFPKLKKLGIVRDADYNTDAFQSVCSALQNANRKVRQHQFPIPTKMELFTDDSPQVGVLCLPDKHSEGMLEDLILTAYEQDEIMACVEQYFECIQAKDMSLKQHILPKAKVRVFLSGKAVDERGSKKDKSAWWMSDIYRSEWWSWEHEAYVEAKAFLTELAT